MEENHNNNNNPNTTSNLNQNKRPETARVFTAGQGSYAANYLTAGSVDDTYTVAMLLLSQLCKGIVHNVKDCRALPFRKPKEDRKQRGQGNDVIALLDCGEHVTLQDTSVSVQMELRRFRGIKFEGNQQNPRTFMMAESKET
ncbi:hypothetical protein Tco_1523267 [Tanacetum coccineum]